MELKGLAGTVKLTEIDRRHKMKFKMFCKQFGTQMFHNTNEIRTIYSSGYT